MLMNMDNIQIANNNLYRLYKLRAITMYSKHMLIYLLYGMILIGTIYNKIEEHIVPSIWILVHCFIHSMGILLRFKYDRPYTGILTDFEQRASLILACIIIISLIIGGYILYTIGISSDYTFVVICLLIGMDIIKILGSLFINNMYPYLLLLPINSRTASDIVGWDYHDISIDVKCVICINDCIDDIDMSLVELSTCKHMFHKKCIDSWLKINNNCPLCRSIVGKKKSPEYTWESLFERQCIYV